MTEQNQTNQEEIINQPIQSTSQSNVSQTPHINPVRIEEQTVTKKIAAHECKIELEKEKITHIVSMIGLLLVFGLTTIQSIVGGVASLIIVFVIAWRLAAVTKKVNYFKNKYSL